MNILDYLHANPPRDEATDPREEAFVACRSLGLDLTSDSVNHMAVGDYVRLAYTAGREQAEARLSSRDVADGIAQAIRYPEQVIGADIDEPLHMLDWQVRAVQQVVAYGVPKETPR